MGTNEAPAVVTPACRGLLRVWGSPRYYLSLPRDVLSISESRSVSYPIGEATDLFGTPEPQINSGPATGTPCLPGTKGSRRNQRFRPPIEPVRFAHGSLSDDRTGASNCQLIDKNWGSSTGTGPRARRRNMDFGCFNCGDTGHYARTCPHPASKQRDWEPPRIPVDDQTAINERGIALCRTSLAQRGNVTT